MSFRPFPIKSVLLKATLKDELLYQLNPLTEFSEGVWNVALVSINYSTNQELTLKYIFSISCNCVKGQKNQFPMKLKVIINP